MSEFRAYTGGYVVLPNETVNDESLSYKARGLLGYMVGRPPGWQFSAERLAAGSPKEGRDAVATGLAELADAGYYRVTKIRTGGGSIAMLTEVAARPDLMPAPDPRAVRVQVVSDGNPQVTPDTGYPVPAGPGSAEPDPANPSPKSVPEESVQKSQKSKSRTGFARRKAEAESEGEGPVHGSLPRDEVEEEPVTTKRLVRVTTGPKATPKPKVVKPPKEWVPGSQNSALLAEVFAEAAVRHSHPDDPRNDTVTGALARRFTKLRDRGWDLDEVHAAINLFFVTEHYQRDDAAFWKTFITNIDALMTKVRSAPRAGESWSDRQRRLSKATDEEAAMHDAAAESALAELMRRYA